VEKHVCIMDGRGLLSILEEHFWNAPRHMGTEWARIVHDALCIIILCEYLIYGSKSLTLEFLSIKPEIIKHENAKGLKPLP